MINIRPRNRINLNLIQFMRQAERLKRVHSGNVEIKNKNTGLPKSLNGIEAKPLLGSFGLTLLGLTQTD